MLSLHQKKLTSLQDFTANGMYVCLTHKFAEYCVREKELPFRNFALRSVRGMCTLDVSQEKNRCNMEIEDQLACCTGKGAYGAA